MGTHWALGAVVSCLLAVVGCNSSSDNKSGSGGEAGDAGGDAGEGGGDASGATTASGSGGTSSDASSGGTSSGTGSGSTSSGTGTGGSSPQLTVTIPEVLPYRGVNLAGAEFGDDELPGVFGTHYVYPDPTYETGYNSAAYYVGKGMTTFRLPFRWERLQQSLNGSFDAAELERLTTTVNNLTAYGAYVIIDPHNYARYYGDIVGSTAVPESALADFWTKLATEFMSNDRVIFGLMNEPKEMNTSTWVDAANAAIVGIRGTGATNLILVPGNRWSGAWSWYNDGYGASDGTGASNAQMMLYIADSGDNYAFEVHQYLDSGLSGTDPNCQSSTIGSETLADFTNWLRTNGKKGFLGEFGGGANSTCLAALDGMLNHIESNTDVWLGWTYWAGGPWWGPNYFLSLEPTGTTDTSQMNTLEPHLGNVTTTPPTIYETLTIDSTGWVGGTSNSLGVQGEWYWFDDDTAYTSVSSSYASDAVPWDSTNGAMCLAGTAGGGTAWGAAIGLTLNQATPGAASLLFTNNPSCYRVTLTGYAPDDFWATLDPGLGGEPPGIALTAGTHDVCLADVAPASTCTSGCLDANDLADGVVSMNVLAKAGASGGAFSFCITKVELIP